MKLAAALLFAAPLIVSTMRAGSIEGRVTNSVTGAPVAGVNLRFIDGHSYVYTTSTDAAGSYRMNGLDSGGYNAQVMNVAGFADYRQGASLEDLMNGGIRVSGDAPAHFDIQLQPWGQLTGRVLDEDGNPAPGVIVDIGLRLDGTATTDANGVFTFDQLRPGSYPVAAKPEPRTRMRDGQKVGSVTIWYPSTTEPADASPVSVAWGQTTAGIEIRLKSVPVRRVTGVVLDIDGKPAAHADVTLLGHPSTTRRSTGFGFQMPPLTGGLRYTSAPEAEPELTSVESRENGTFEFPVVEPGEWRLRADVPEGGKPRSGVAPLFVGDDDVANVQIHMSGPFSVPVTVDWSGSDPSKPGAEPPKPNEGGLMSGPRLMALSAQEGQLPLTFDPTANPLDVSGVYPGRYRVVSAMLSGSYYAQAVMLEGRDVLGQIIELTPGIGPLHVIAKHDTGAVRGAVQDGKGATVFLVPKSPGEIVNYASARCGPGGTFEFSDVIPGAYYVLAFDHAGPLPSADLPDSLATLSEETKVEPGSPGLPLNLRLNKWPW